MRKRSLSIILLTLAFLFSAWGNVIGAAFCPRYLHRVCCATDSVKQSKPVVVQPSCHHHEMAGMEMDDAERSPDMQAQSGESPDIEGDPEQTSETSQVESGSDASGNPVAFDLPVETCGHCWVHSQPASGSANVVAVDPSKRIIDTDALSTNDALVLRSALPVRVEPSEHGPPGNSIPRHVLINVFQI
ncbi:MAG: hypothetical protein QOH71_2697 [Blastocatellia bacterium]|nr:hypothetical protein [Blastocatellia bacterium]